MEVGVIQVAADEDFEKLWKMVSDDNTWKLEYQHEDTEVWSKHSNNTDIKIVKVMQIWNQFMLLFYHSIYFFMQAKSTFQDISMWELFDVLMDGEYRPLWDTHMVESFTLGYINPNNDIGYYASEFCFEHKTINQPI